MCVESHSAAFGAGDVHVLAAATRLAVTAQGAAAPQDARVRVAGQLCAAALARATLPQVPPPPPPPPLHMQQPRVGLLDIGGEALARALARFWSAQYRALDLAAETAPEASASCGLMRWRSSAARIALWLAAEVTEQPGARRRGAALRAVLAAMTASRRLADFQSLRVAADALCHPAVLGAAHLWDALAPRRATALAALVHCVADDDGTAAPYRDAFAAAASASSSPPPIPLLDVHLRDLAALDTLSQHSARTAALVGRVLGTLAAIQHAHAECFREDDSGDDSPAVTLVRAASAFPVSSDDIVTAAVARGCIAAPPAGPIGSTRALLDMLKVLSSRR